MKMALSCDHLLEDDHRMEILKFFISLWPNTDIHTFAYRQGKIDLHGCPIHVIPYSRMASDLKKFARWSFLIPGFAKKAKIPSSLDLIINLSSGLSHGILKSKNTKQITYLYDWDFQEDQRGFSEFFFRSFRYKWVFESLRQSDLVFVSSSERAKLVGAHVDEEKIKVLRPFLNERVMEQDFQKGKNSYLLGTMGLSEKRKKAVMDKLDEMGVDYSLFKQEINDDNISSLISCKGLIDFSRSYFPLASLSAVANGKTVISFSRDLHEDWFENIPGICFFHHDSELPIALEYLKRTLGDLERVKMKEEMMKYHPRHFKDVFTRQMKAMFPSL